MSVLTWVEHATDLTAKIVDHVRESGMSLQASTPAVTANTTAGDNSPVINGNGNIVTYHDGLQTSNRRPVPIGSRGIYDAKKE